MKPRIVLVARGIGSSVTVALRPTTRSPPRLCGPSDSQSPVLGAGRCGGMIWDSLQKVVTLCQGVQAVMPGWGTRFTDAPEGLDLVWGGGACRPPDPVATRCITPGFATPAAVPGGFPCSRSRLPQRDGHNRCDGR